MNYNENMMVIKYTLNLEVSEEKQKKNAVVDKTVICLKNAWYRNRYDPRIILVLALGLKIKYESRMRNVCERY